MGELTSAPPLKMLGILPGFKMKKYQEPVNYLTLLGKLPEGAEFTYKGKDLDMVHIFVFSKKDLKKYLPIAQNEIHKEGFVWVSWMRDRKGFESELSETLLKKIAREHNMVDVKDFSLDDKWDAMKMVWKKGIK